MPIEEESEKVSRNSEIESLCQSLKSLYIDIIKNAESAQNKFPLQNTENKCSRDNLLCYLALREHDLSDLQLKLAEQGPSSLGRLESQVIVTIEKVIKSLGLSPHETNSLCNSNSTLLNSTLPTREKYDTCQNAFLQYLALCDTIDKQTRYHTTEFHFRL
jgi:hypothetical protein